MSYPTPSPPVLPAASLPPHARGIPLTPAKTSGWSYSNRPRPTLSDLLTNAAVAAGQAALIYALYRAGAYIAQRYNQRSQSSQPAASAAAQPIGSSRSSNPYETPTQLHEYLQMHYALPSQLLAHDDVVDIPWAAMHFPAECGRECVKWLKSEAARWPAGGGGLRVLDVGCAVGRSSFEAARYATDVLGIDFSHSFIAAANQLKETGRMEYLVKVEGDITEKAMAEIQPGIDRSRVRFIQGDACSLSAITPPLQPVHCILAANLVCRLPHPLHFLHSLPSLVLPHGFVVLYSPHTWLTEYTSREEWLGGYYDGEGKAVRTGERLKGVMEGGGKFKLVGEKNVPFFIRETYRKNQWSIAHCTVFQRTEVA